MPDHFVLNRTVVVVHDRDGFRLLCAGVLGQLAREAKRNPLKYSEFYNEFGSYIKEGACTGPSLSRNTQLGFRLCRVFSATYM